MVKKALEGLEGVQLVEDEWTREMEADEPLDLLFITYDANQIAVDTMFETIKQHGFEGELK